MFVDRAKINVIAGKGGDGAISFRHEKYIEFGGPNGGNGGKGGSVVFVATTGANSLIKFRHIKKIKADDGDKGLAKMMYGRAAKDSIYEVPVGTMILDEDEHPIADLVKEGDSFTVCKGGRGGRGNACFSSSINRTPRTAENGLPGEQKNIILELKLLADVGLVGLPSVGKSSFLSVVSNAKPDIAEYEFTTLSPNLGVVKLDEERNFVIADLPGLIEGAHLGRGLGLTFLRHIERCRVIIHVIDISRDEEDAIVSFNTINDELLAYKMDLSKRPMIVALNKIDLLENDEKVNRFKAEFEGRYEIFEISTLTHEGVDKLLSRAYRLVQETPFFPLYKSTEGDEVVLTTSYKQGSPLFEIRKDQYGRYVISGERVIRTYRIINIQEEEGMMKLLSYLSRIGVDARLREMQVKDGSTVVLDDFEFEYYN